MKYIGWVAFGVAFVALCYIGYLYYGLSVETTVTEKIGDMTCVGSGVNGEIRGHAICTYSGFDSKLYSGGFYNHNLNGYGIVYINNRYGVISNILQDGFFNDGYFMMGSREGKIGFFDKDGNFKKGMRRFLGGYDVGDFVGGELFNGYSISGPSGFRPVGCVEYKDGIATDITKTVTKTVTNTVYRNGGIQLTNPLGDFYKLGSQYNPYTVKLEFK